MQIWETMIFLKPNLLRPTHRVCYMRYCAARNLPTQTAILLKKQLLSRNACPRSWKSKRRRLLNLTGRGIQHEFPEPGPQFKSTSFALVAVSISAPRTLFPNTGQSILRSLWRRVRATWRCACHTNSSGLTSDWISISSARPMFPSIISADRISTVRRYSALPLGK